MRFCKNFLLNFNNLIGIAIKNLLFNKSHVFRRFYLDNDVELTPFNRSVVNSIRTKVLDWMKEKNIKADNSQELIRNRNKLVVCKTFHGAGLVVPFDKKADLGYRPLIETDGNEI